MKVSNKDYKIIIFNIPKEIKGKVESFVRELEKGQMEIIEPKTIKRSSGNFRTKNKNSLYGPKHRLNIVEGRISGLEDGS